MIYFDSIELLLILQSLRLSGSSCGLIEKIEDELYKRQEAADFENRKREVKEFVEKYLRNLEDNAKR